MNLDISALSVGAKKGFDKPMDGTQNAKKQDGKGSQG